jgi:hypothetical protein
MGFLLGFCAFCGAARGEKCGKCGEDVVIGGVVLGALKHASFLK